MGFNQKWLLALGMLNWKLKYMNKCSKVTLVKFKKKKIKLWLNGLKLMLIIKLIFIVNLIGMLYFLLGVIS